MTILTLNDIPDPRKTVHQVLPYTFQILNNGKMRITNTRSQVLNVTRQEVENILANPDLDVHRRRMYEAALAEFNRKAVK